MAAFLRRNLGVLRAPVLLSAHLASHQGQDQTQIGVPPNWNRLQFGSQPIWARRIPEGEWTRLPALDEGSKVVCASFCGTLPLVWDWNSGEVEGAPCTSPAIHGMVAPVGGKLE